MNCGDSLVGRSAVVLGLSPTGLHVARALGNRGVHVVGVAEGVQAGWLSRFVRQSWKSCPSAGSPGKLGRLLEFAKRWRDRHGFAPVLIPTADQEVDFVVQHADQLREVFAIQGSYTDGLALAIMSKDAFYQTCTRFGVSIPRLVEADRDSLADAIVTLGYPVLVKPARVDLIKRAMRGAKGWVIQDAADLAACLRSIPCGAGTLLVQEIVPGPESNITLVAGYFDRQGIPRQMFSARKLRQFPAGFGSASLVQSCCEEESLQVATRLLGSLNYRGIAAAEFKRHPNTGELYMIEVNVRPSLWFGITERAGCPVVLEAFRDLSGMALLGDRHQVDGVRWRYGLKDAASACFYRLNSGFVLPSPDLNVVGRHRASVSAVFNWRDPLPVAAECFGILAKALGRGSSKARSREHGVE